MSYPNSTNFFMTKKELYNFFPSRKKDIDDILQIISIDIKDIKKIKDTYLLLKYNDTYILYFIWDFLYNLYDILEKKVIEHYNKDKYYLDRGTNFENYCFQKLVDAFPKFNIFKNLYYKGKTVENEIDILLETNNEIIIFECKSAKFDIHKTENDNEMKNAFLRAFGRGFKTINNFYNYIKNNGNELYDKRSKQCFSFDFKTKKVIFINLSLYNIEYLQSCVQNISEELIKPVNMYPINWNFIDFLTIMDLAKFNYKLVSEYLNKRFNIINKHKKLKLDEDEIDAFGFLTDKNNNKIYNMLLNTDSNINTEFMISNGEYRNTINKLFNERFINRFRKQNYN